MEPEEIGLHNLKPAEGYMVVRPQAYWDEE